MQHISLDALVAPTGGPAWTTDLVNGDHFSGASSTPAAVAGYPSITVPAGDVFGLPVGDLVHRQGVVGAEADRARVRVRAGDETSASAGVSALKLADAIAGKLGP